jgi:hypothetical protein
VDLGPAPAVVESFIADAYALLSTDGGNEAPSTISRPGEPPRAAWPGDAALSPVGEVQSRRWKPAHAAAAAVPEGSLVRALTLEHRRHTLHTAQRVDLAAVAVEVADHVQKDALPHGLGFAPGRWHIALEVGV